MVGPALGLRRAADLFGAAKTAEGLSPRSIAWYAMILDRLVERFGPERPVDGLTPPELRAWLVELRSHLAPISVAGYVRGLRAVGNWLAADGLAEARALRTLARPRVPRRQNSAAGSPVASLPKDFRRKAIKHLSPPARHAVRGGTSGVAG